MSTKRQLPNVSSRYGAPMGRPETRTEPDLVGPFHLERLRWVDYGYDQGGAYWGWRPGEYIYWAYAESEDGELQQTFVRATSRDEAKRLVRETFYEAKFYR